jgi:hypothetical protein
VQRKADRLLSPQDHRNHAHVYVVLHARVKVLERHVTGDVIERVRGRAKVTRVDRDPADGVAVASLLGRGEVEADDLVLVLLRQKPPVDGRRLGECTTEANDLLELLSRVHLDGMVCGQLTLDGLHRERRLVL